MSELCLGCMKEYENGSVCPHCGFSNDSEQSLPFFPLGTVLRDRYIVGKLLTSDSQGAEYLCYDDELKSPAVLREFLPEGICGRSRSSGVNVLVKTEHKETYARLQKSFLSYFRTIARLRDLNSISTIYDIFSDNNTAYTVEDYEELITFKEFIVRSGGHLEWNVARPLFMPLISALETVNKNGVSHLGVSPENLYVTESGKLLLRGFMIPEMRKANREIHTSLIRGCAAPEQYAENGIINESTDIYGLTAVMFYALTGSLPDSYEKRKLDNRLLIKTNVVKRLPPHVVSALASGLQFLQSKRTSSFEELKALLTSAPTVKAMREEIKSETQANNSSVKNRKQPRRGIPTFVWGIISCVIAGLVFTLIGNSLLDKNLFDAILNSSESSRTASDTDSLLLVSDIDSEDKSKIVVVPDFDGMDFKQIVEDDEAHKEYNVVFSNPGEYNDSIPRGSMISQNPEPETELPYDSVIVVTLSLGSESRQLPDIKNKKIESVADILGEEEFITYIEREYDDKVAEGCVIGYKGYSAGDYLRSGSSITVIVSKGSEDPSSDAQ